MEQSTYNVWEAVQGVASTFTIVAGFVAIGYIVHQVRATAVLLEKVDARLTEHMLDRDVHPDVPALNEELRELRGRTRGGHA